MACFDALRRISTQLTNFKCFSVRVDAKKGCVNYDCFRIVHSGQ
nr:MAG TPA: hypothetical protein [Caudoviricetes sp.]